MASSRSLSSGAHSRDPLAPGNDDSKPHFVAAEARGAVVPSAAAIADISGFMK